MLVMFVKQLVFGSSAPMDQGPLTPSHITLFYRHYLTVTPQHESRQEDERNFIFSTIYIKVMNHYAFHLTPPTILVRKILF
jgi:hypothetical protein